MMRDQPNVALMLKPRVVRKPNPARGLMLMVWTLNNRLLFTAIFISGASALVYQLIWVRLLGLVFGVSSFAVATVVAVFLLGLGLGSYVFGRWSERARDPLRIYMYVELGIAATSLLAFIVLAAYGFFLIYTLTGDVSRLARSMESVVVSMDGVVTTMTTVSGNVAAMSSNHCSSTAISCFIGNAALLPTPRMSQRQAR